MNDEPKENGIQRLMRVNQEQAAELACWKWFCEMRLRIEENAFVGRPLWTVLDVDGEVIGVGDQPVFAIQDARRKLETT